MFDKALPDGSDLSALASSGMFSVKAPVNGPSSNDAFVLSFAGLAAGKTFEYQLFIDSADGSAHTRARTGGAWTDWASLGSGGGGGGSSAADVTFDPAAIISGVLPSFPLPLGIADFASWITDLGLAGTIDDVEGALSTALSVALAATHAAAQASAKATIIRSQRAPTTSDGIGIDFTNATDFEQPNTFALAFGSFWVDVGSGRNDVYMLVTDPQGGTGNVYKKLNN